MIDYTLLENRFDDVANDLRRSAPFGHAICDGFFLSSEASEVSEVFPALPEMDIISRDGSPRVGELRDRGRLHPRMRAACDELASDRFVAWLSAAANVRSLCADADGWGVVRNAEFGVIGALHTPPARHPAYGWRRALSVIVYCEPDWSEVEGGMLELWDEGAGAPAVSICPVFNRAVIMVCGKQSFHAQSRINAKLPRTRKTMAAWYYVRDDVGDGVRGLGEAVSGP